jgi:hypothetical protein
MGGVAANEKAAGDIASQQNRVQNFQNAPAIQRAIRNSLGGSGTLNSGAAASTLAQPIINAAQSSADFDAQMQGNLLQNQAARAENLASTGFSTRQAATAKRLGIDQDTLDTLTKMGRSDLVDKFTSLSDVQGQEGANELAIEQAKQQNDIAQAQAAAAKRGGLFSQVGQIGGGVIGGMFGGAPGAAAGMSLGGSLGGMAGGNTNQQFDPTMLFALANRNKTAIQNRLGTANTSQFGNVNTYSPTRAQMGY